MNLGSLLRQAAQLFPERDGLIVGEQRWCWREIDERVDKIRDEFVKAMQRGDVADKLSGLGGEPVGSTPAELAAIEAGQTTAEYCDEQHEIQKRVGAGFNLSFDWFGRTSRPGLPSARWR